MNPRVLIPAAVVVLCAWVGGTMPRDHAPSPIINGCDAVPTDGPQFACALAHDDRLRPQG